MTPHHWALGGLLLLALGCGPTGDWEAEAPAEATPGEDAAPAETEPIKAFAAGDTEWMRTTRSGGFAVGRLVRTDSSGNSYTALSHAGGTRIGGVTLPEEGGVALVSHSASGRLRWVRTFRCTTPEQSLEPRDLWVTPGGRSMLTLEGRCPADLGGGPLDGRSYVVAVGVGGQYRWSRVLAPADTLTALNVPHVTVSPVTNEVLVAGSVAGPITIEGTTYTFFPAGTLLLRYSDRGAFLGVRALEQSAGDLIVRDVAYDGAGRLLALFTASGTVDAGGGPIRGRGNYPLLIVSYSATGRVLWDYVLDGTLEPTALAVYGNRVVATGRFHASITFRGQTYSVVPPGPGAPPTQGFVLALSRSSGSERWMELRGRHIRDVAVDANGGVTVLGDFLGLGPTPVPSLTAQFVAKHDRTTGRTRWRRVFDSSARLWSVGATSGGTPLVTGDFTGTVNLGSGPRTAFPENSSQAFLLRLQR